MSVTGWLREITGGKQGVRPSTAKRLGLLDGPKPGLVGRVQRQARRCLLAYGGRATTTQLLAWAYPERDPPYETWQYRNVRRAAARWAVPERRSTKGIGAPWLWKLKTPLDD